MPLTIVPPKPDVRLQERTAPACPVGGAIVHEITAAVVGRRSDTLKSVGTALDVLGCFSRDVELGVSDVARRLGIAKSTAHRLLSTLRSRGIVEQNPETGEYRLGLRLAEYGNLARDRHPVRHAILSHLVDLRRATGLPVRVAAPDAGDIVVVDHLSSSAAPPWLEDLPWRRPLHHSAAGIAVSAFNPFVAEERPELGFGPDGPVRSVAEFDAALAGVRAHGVSVQTDSGLRGVTTIASPIRGLGGTAYMAVGVVAPTADIGRVVERLSRLVVVAGNRITRSASPIIAGNDGPLLPALLA